MTLQQFNIQVSESSWPPARVAQLKALALTGQSARQIGATLGTSKNAIIGKLRRINVPLLSNWNNQHSGPEWKRTPRLRSNRPKPALNIAVTEPCSIQDLGSIAQMDRCRFVLDAPTAKALYCGAASEGPWCPRHRAMIYSKPTQMNRLHAGG